MLQNKIVIRYHDGRIVKGYTGDFLPTKPVFHLTPYDAPAGERALAVQMADLKAVFFVKDLAGNSEHKENLEFQPGKPVVGRKIKVTFKDGETLVGSAPTYSPEMPGFFVFPADTRSNTLKVFALAGSVKSVRWL